MSAPTAPKLRHISNSEVATFNNCERKYYYNFDLNLAPKKYGPSLQRGSCGHQVLEVFYKIIMQGQKESGKINYHNDFYARAIEAARQELAKLLRDGHFSMEIVVDVERIVERYFEFARNDNWEIVAVEAHHAIDLTDQFDFVLRLDLLAKVAGELMVIDHKVCYNFYTTNEINFMPQLPKYIASLRASGIMVERAMLNMLRWRTQKDMSDENMFRREFIKPDAIPLRNHMREQLLAARRIVNHRALSVEERERNVTRNMSNMNCRGCSYGSLCLAELYGKNIAVDIELDYEPNTYGYNEVNSE